jgi:predicted nucleic acid-binding protein
VSLYLDTSALIKLYVSEMGSEDVARWVASASRVATSRVAYPEARAGLARRAREGALTAAHHRRCVRDLDRDFTSLVVVEIDAVLAQLAGELAVKRALRGFDAIHLASAMTLRARAPEFTALGVFDARLEAGARAEGFLAP